MVENGHGHCPAVAAVAVMARDIDPIVSTDWLQKNLKNQELVIVDLRKVEEYKAGHIPGAVNVFYGSWAIKKGNCSMNCRLWTIWRM